MSGVATVMGYALRESLRRRVFVIVLILTVCFLALYALAAREAFSEVTEFRGVVDEQERILFGATLLGLAMFGTLFLGAVLAVFLTLGVVRGDAERGLLQPLVVRPIGRVQLLVGRFLAAGAVCALYVFAVYLAAVAITDAIGGWSPDRLLLPGVSLAGGMLFLVAVSLLGSVFLSATANGIAIFMVFGAGLVGGLLGQLGEGLQSPTLEDIGRNVSWALPFEALYQSGLSALTEDTVGFAKIVVNLGPFGGARDMGAGIWPWTAAYTALVGVLAAVGFARRDL
ncbi:MAG: Chromosome (plasmid) partitioning protein ParB [uncultured Thermoleophilia bacterium]|uniref:Chromosome (Plasmid) partitioning protein ParB n=1 Tax=uncultured Thermoleophilia bacterium TaxID=1497501 RepID=A0A6J4TTS1_9ACTN|nr:MAG: Chromosome (plasmid) partitioning protein ParB [uncultured Thermoleophilia bacterium]